MDNPNLDPKVILNSEASDLQTYFSAIDELTYLLDYEDAYKEALNLVRTWQYRQPFRRLTKENLLQPYREASRAFTQFIMITHTAIEHLCSRLLLRKIDPSNEALCAKVIDDMRQSRREEFLHNFQVIDGDFYNRMCQFRGTRNTFAHDWGTHFNFDKSDTPLEVIAEGREIVEKLVRKAYGEPFKEIISYLQECYRPPKCNKISNWKTMQIARKYNREYNWFVDIEANVPSSREKNNLEKLEKELRERGYDPEVARQRDQVGRVPRNRKGVGSADGEIIKNLRVSCPSEIEKGEKTELAVYMDLGQEWYLPLESEPVTEVDWRIMLLIDGIVHHVIESDDGGYPDSLTLGEEYKFTISHSFVDEGNSNVTIGVVLDSGTNLAIAEQAPVPDN